MQSRSRFLKAAFCEQTDRPPVWLMRQAGRHLPEYQALRQKHELLAMMQNEELVVEVSLQPWRRYKTDAVIVFSDILIPVNAIGMDLKFIEGQGPKFAKLIASESDLKNLKLLEPEKDVPFLISGLQTLRKELKEEAALLGFAGAPFTVASYIAKNFSEMRKEKPALLKKILKRVAEETITYLSAQIEAEVDAIQLFDSWGGSLTTAQYREWSAPYIKEIVDALKPTDVPVILFIQESRHLLEEMMATGCQVISIGWETPLAEAKAVTKGKVAIQGNLNPHILMQGSVKEIRSTTQKMLEEMRETSGYIANLGHGVLPKTPVANVEAFVETVKGFPLTRE